METLDVVDITKNMCREIVASWMIRNSFSTGHGDTIEDLLNELEEQTDSTWLSHRR